MDKTRRSSTEADEIKVTSCPQRREPVTRGGPHRRVPHDMEVLDQTVTETTADPP